MSGELVPREEVGELVGRLSERDLDARDRRRLLARLTGLLAGRFRAAGARAALSGRWLVRRLGRNVTTMAPFMAGAIAGAELNRRETRSLGEALIGELRSAR